MNISDTAKSFKFVAKNPKFIAKNILSKKDFSQIIKDMAIELGASEVGIATKKTLEGGPESTDLEYALPGAKSAIVFAIPFNQELIEPYLSKESHSLNKNKIDTTTFAGGIALQISEFLNQLGYDSKPISPNFVYRRDTPNGNRDMKPVISHRYLAARSGVGFFGLSGHILTKKHGAAVVLASVITVAELKPTEPLNESENYCDECNLCITACIPKFVQKNGKTTVKLGDVKFEYGKRGDYNRCSLVCSGLTGLHPSKKWSTWSPARFEIPQKDEDFRFAMLNTIPTYLKRPKKGEFFFHPIIPGHKMNYTCSNCQFICHPNKEVRKNRFRMLREGGVVIEDEEGNIRTVSPENADMVLEKMSKNRKKLYTN